MNFRRRHERLAAPLAFTSSPRRCLRLLPSSGFAAAVSC
jgi:hypothetical protein